MNSVKKYDLEDRLIEFAIKIILKELRETNICLKIIKRKPLIRQSQRHDKVIKECNELISIFVSSIRTAQKQKYKVKKI